MTLFLGLNSGTSMDAIDVALIDFSDDGALAERAFSKFPYSEALASSLHAARREGNRLPLAELYRLDVKVARAFADAANRLLRDTGTSASSIAGIGSHGQTLFHEPRGETPFTVQIGDPNLLAALTGIVTVADFRRMDLAVGGVGAPLAPAFHHYAFRHADRHRAIVNIGGIANITLLPARHDGDVTGFDTGPGNGLMDDWIHTHLGAPYDKDGDWARSGIVSEPLLRSMLDDPYFHQRPPKSTGREYFNTDWITRHVERTRTTPAANDVQATLLRLTAISIALSLRRAAIVPTELFVCGGGAHNGALMQELSDAITPCVVATTTELGIAPEAVEAVMFAWLARQRLAGLAGNLPAVTGARKPAVLGGVYLPPA